jgi:hypothetical protein
MEQQAEGSGIFRPAFFDAQEDVSGHYDGRVSMRAPKLRPWQAFFQFQMLLGRAEEYNLDAPALAVNAVNVFIATSVVRPVSST